MATATTFDPTAANIEVFDIRVGEEALADSPAAYQMVTVSLGEGLHDAATITMKINKPSLDIYVGRPISFSYGPLRSFNRFIGYVTRVVPSRNYRADLTATFECLGATWPLRTGSPRQFVGQTIQQLASAILAPHRLGMWCDDFRVGDRPYAFSSVTQSGESDWEFLVKVAHRAGFVVYTSDGVVRVVDPLRVLRTHGVFLLLLKNDEFEDRTRVLLDFTPQSEASGQRRLHRQRFGYFTSAGAATLSSGDSTHRFDPTMTITDQTQADVALQASDNDPDHWSQHATARILGRARLTPGMVVAIQLSPSQVIHNDYDGVWLVRSVSHVITQNSFQSDLALSRTLVPRAQNSEYQEWFQASNRPRPALLRQEEVDGSARWISTWAGSPTTTISLSTPVGSTGNMWKGTV